MNEEKRDLLKEKREFFESGLETIGKRDGIPIEKGVTLNEEYLIKNQKHLEEIYDTFVAYPDIYLDLISPPDSSFKFFFYQRIFLRAVMRYKTIYVVACRAWSKSFLTILGLFLQCVFIPGRKVFICAPKKQQGAQIAKEKIYEIYKLWPILKSEVIRGDIEDQPGNFGRDYVTIKFRNGSILDVVGALESTLGGRRHGQEFKNFLFPPKFMY